MNATVPLFFLLVISTLVAGRTLPQNDPGSGMYDANYPVDDEIDNVYQDSARFVEHQSDLDFPIDEENDPGSSY